SFRFFIFFFMLLRPPSSPLFPYTTLFRSVSIDQYAHVASFFNANLAGKFPFVANPAAATPDASPEDLRTFFEMLDSEAKGIKATDRKSTRLNSSHRTISYAVFCLKKKNKN